MAAAASASAAAEGDITSPILALEAISATRPPVLFRKALLPSSSGGSFPAARCSKKTRDLPDLCVCHGCGLRYPDKGRSGSLSTIKSQWRLVLLCSGCGGHLRSGAMCSYCLSRFSEADEGGSMSCIECRRRVHLACLPRQRGFVFPCDLDPRTFVCVDCHAVAKFLRPRISCREPGNVPCVSTEDVVRNANYIAEKKQDEASRAKNKALEKALAARYASELARNALDLVALVSKRTASGTDLSDQEMLLRLHRTMNGSQRIPRSPCSSSSGNLCHSKRRVVAGLSSGRKSASGTRDVSLEVHICMENKSMEAIDVGALENSVYNLEVETKTLLESTIFVDKSMGSDGGKSNDNMEEDPGKEEQASCSDKVAASAVGDNSADSISTHSERSSNSLDEQGIPNGAVEGGLDKDVYVAQLQTASNVGDRYVKKYTRNFKMKRYGKKYCRNPRLANHVDEK